MPAASLGLIANFARDSDSFRRQIKADPSVKRLYKALITGLTRDDLAEIVGSLSSLSSLLLNEPLGQKLFNRENIDQSLDMAFNVVQECLENGGDSEGTHGAPQFWVFARCIDLLVDLTRSPDAVAALSTSSRFRTLLGSLARLLCVSGDAVPAKALELFAALCGDCDAGPRRKNDEASTLQSRAIDALTATGILEAAPFGKWILVSETVNANRAYSVLLAVATAASPGGHSFTRGDSSTLAVHRVAADIVRRLGPMLAAKGDDVVVDQRNVEDLCELNVYSDAAVGRDVIRPHARGFSRLIQLLFAAYSTVVVSSISDRRRVNATLQSSVCCAGILLALDGDGENLVHPHLPRGWEVVLRDSLQSSRFPILLFGLRAATSLPPLVIGTCARVGIELSVVGKPKTGTHSHPSSETGTPERGLRASDMSTNGGARSGSGADVEVVSRLLHGLREKDMKSSEQLSVYESQVREAASREAKHVALLDAKSTELQQANNLVEEYRKRQAELTAQFSTMRQLLESSERRMEDAVSATAQHQASEERLKAEVERLRASEASLQDRVAAVTSEYDRTVEPLRESEAQLLSECADLRDKIEAELTAAAEVSKEKLRLQEKLEATTNLSGELQTSVRELTEVNARQRGEMTQLEQTVQELHAKSDWLVDEHATAVSDAERARSEARESDRMCQVLTKQVRDLEEKLSKQQQIAAMIHNLSSAATT